MSNPLPKEHEEPEDANADAGQNKWVIVPRPQGHQDAKHDAQQSHGTGSSRLGLAPLLLRRQKRRNSLGKTKHLNDLAQILIHIVFCFFLPGERSRMGIFKKTIPPKKWKENSKNHRTKDWKCFSLLSNKTT